MGCGGCQRRAREFERKVQEQKKQQKISESTVPKKRMTRAERIEARKRRIEARNLRIAARNKAK